jgi:hypothetical protein
MMILFVKLTKGIGHKFYQLMKSSPIDRWLEPQSGKTKDYELGI